MGDFGDILYILVMIGALVLSVLKKSRSKEQQGDGMPENEASPFPEEAFPPFGEWLEDERRPQAQPTNTSEAIPQPMKAEKLEPQKLNYKKPDYQSIKRSDSLKRAEQITRITRRPETKILEDEDDSYNTSSWLKEERYDWRKAVIYSEVLKRPII